MKKEKDLLGYLLDHGKLILALVCAVVLLLIVNWCSNSIKQTTVGLEVDDRIDITPQQIESIKEIGEWEFLSVSDEELVDTVRKGFFTDDHLVRIYYGTVRLGVNLHQVKPNWITTQGDSIEVILPKVGLLDRDFIDEARTKSFYESGSWTPKDREALYQRAYRQMKAHCLTPQNLESARQNGEAQFQRMMKSMGFNHVSVTFEE